jgi:hypothetical protein
MSVGFLATIQILLCFWSLGDRVLWQDEAETAVLAKNVLKSGWPVACDGRNLVSQERNREFGTDFIWRWSGWLQIYLAALSFKLFGITTFSARFPFALIGVLTPFLTFFFVRRAFKDEPLALLAMAILTFSIPFILFERQCRYFPLLSLLSVIANIGVMGIINNRRWAYPCYVISMLLFMQANHLNLVFFAGSIFLAGIVVFFDVGFVKRFLLANVITALLIFPSAAWQYQLFNQAEMLNLFEFPRNIEMAFSDTLTYFLPLPVLLIFIYLLACNFIRSRALTDSDKIAAFIGLQILLYLLSISISPQYFTRYLVCLIPLFAIVCAIACMRIIRFAALGGLLLAGMVVFTNWMNIYPMQILGIANWSGTVSRQSLPFPNVPLLLYLNELSTEYRGPDEGLVAFFKARNNPSETIMLTYGALPLMFYTDFNVIDGMGNNCAPNEFKPDWLVIRKDTRFWGEPVLETLWTHSFIDLNIDLGDYEPIAIPYAGHKHGNRSDPRYHRFYNDVHPGNLLTIFKKKTNEHS